MKVDQDTQDTDEYKQVRHQLKEEEEMERENGIAKGEHLIERECACLENPKRGREAAEREASTQPISPPTSATVACKSKWQ